MLGTFASFDFVCLITKSRALVQILQCFFKDMSSLHALLNSLSLLMM